MELDLDKDFEALARLIKSFEQLVDGHQLDDDTYEKYQLLLDRFADKYQHDESAGPRRFMLYELQALLFQVRGDYEKAVAFLMEASNFLSNEVDFVSNAARSWFRQYATEDQESD